jgi:FkbM family methyltransferase
MKIPGWVHDPIVYPRARVAILSMLGEPRFYGPVSAINRYEHRVSHPESVELLRQENGLSIWQTPDGERATMATELKGHLAGLLSEFKSNQYLQAPLVLRPGAIVLDVGANIGMFTLQALREGAQQVISFEPNPETRKALEWNIASVGGLDRATVMAKGAWNEAGAFTMTVDPFRPGRSSVVVPSPDQAAYQVEVELGRLDDMASMVPRVDFIKMDIEGAEINALKGATEILSRWKPQLSIAVEHTDDRLRNAEEVRETVLAINPKYLCIPGPYTVTPDRKLAPDILYFQ